MAIKEIIIKYTCGCVDVETKKPAINTITCGRGIVPDKSILTGACPICRRKRNFVEYKGLDYDEIKKEITERDPDIDEKGEMLIDGN